MIKAVIFDIDGTILDTSELILQSFEHTLETHKIPAVERAELKKKIGPPLFEIYADLAPHLNPAELMETHRSFQVDNIHLSRPFLDTFTTLGKLKKRGIKLAAVTNRTNRSSLKTLQLARIDDFFEIVISPEDVKNEKPDPEGIQLALEHMKVQTSEALMVGDTSADVGAGKAAGVKTVGITHGIRGDSVKEYHPDFLIHSLPELLELDVFS